MNKILLLAALWASFCSIIAAQHIPDLAFANAIRRQCSTCIDANNNLLPPATNQRRLYLDYVGIHNLEGIDGFTNLDTLICYSNSITDLPILPSSLRYLDCNDNDIRNLATLPNTLTHFNCSANKLGSLDSLPDSLRYLNCEHNFINYLDDLPSNLVYFNCKKNYISSLSALPNTLIYLNCNRNELLSLPNLPNSLTYLDFSINSVSSLPNLPSNLDTLICFNNRLSTLPALPSSLIELDCSDNQITTLPVLPQNLLHFNCSVNPLSAANIVLPSTLVSFECYSCHLNNLPILPVNLRYLNCYNNLLTNLPTILPNDLIGLDCGVNLLTNLPATLPPNLTLLSCKFNQLTTLPSLPPNLSVLQCQSNQLTALPNLPNSLSVLTCNHNQITALPALPSGVYDLDCGANHLIILPPLPLSLNSLDCSSNQLSLLPSLPFNLNRLICSDNPNLYCLPPLPGNLQHLFCVNTGVSCIPNLTGWIHQYYLPVCNSTNNNNACLYSTAEGRVYYDANNDGVYNINDGDTAMVNKTVFSNHSLSVCDSNGFYRLLLDSNSVNEFGVDWLYWYDSTYFIATPEYYSITTTNNRQTFLNNDFRLYKTQPLTDVVVWRALSAIPDKYRVGFNSIFWIEYANVGNMVADGTISITLDNRVSFVEASQSVTQNGQVITFNYNNLQLFEQRYFAVKVYTPAAIPLGDTIRHLTTIASVNPDNNLNGNVFENVGLTVGAYDPNNILASDTMLCLDDFSTAYDFIHYKINFQNTGTDYAQNVIVTDTLSDLLDISSFRPLSASHPYTLKVENYSKNGVDKKVLKWIFDDIFLVDSFANELLSHGFISYKVRPKTNPMLNYNDIINSQAHIYFDFNPAVNTNTNQINTNNCSESLLDKNDFVILPNPNRGVFWVQINIKIAANCKCIIYNSLGQAVYQQNINNNLPELNLSHLQAGVYNLQIINENSTATKSFVISR